MMSNKSAIYDNIIPSTSSGGGGTFSGWQLDGNTEGSEKFIGTKNAFDFPVRVNNIQVGKFLSAPTSRVEIGDSTLFNCFVGIGAGIIPTGTENTGFGYQSLSAITTGFLNTAFGKRAGTSLSTGSVNVFIGGGAGLQTTTGSGSVYIGYHCGQGAITGGENVAVGREAFLNGNGGANIAIGALAMTANYTGGYNTVIGWQGLPFNNGSANISIGVQTGYNATAINGCILIGNFSGYNLTNQGNRLIIDNQIRYAVSGQSEATDSIIYGIMDDLNSVQHLAFNAAIIYMRYLPTSSVGLLPGRLWNNLGIVNIV